MLLIGAGRAHLQVLKQLNDHPLPSVEVTLLTPHNHYYHSGMFPGYIEGYYKLNELSIDIDTLTTQANVKWVKASALSLDAPRKKILTDQGNLLGFDFVSFNIEANSKGTDQPSVIDKAFTLQPKSSFLEKVPALRDSENFVIVGSSWTALELAFSFQAWRNKHKNKQPLTLISLETLFPSKSQRISTKIEKVMKAIGIIQIKAEDLPTIQDREITLDNNISVPYKNLLWLTKPRAPKIFGQALLPTDEKGFLQVERTMQVKEFPYIFGAGECISLSHVQKGIDYDTHLELQANLLWENLKGYALNGEGYLYEPPKDAGTTLSLGNKTSLFLFQNKAIKSKWAWRAKQRGYRKFMETFKNP